MKRSSLRSVAELSEFIENGEFRYAAQFIKPVHEARTTVRWFEWLIRPRLDDPDVSTADFINAVESRDLSLDLDMRAIADALLWIDQQPVNTVLSINVSAASFANRHFSRYVENRIDGSHLLPEQLCFDIGVHDALGDLSSATRFIKTMRRLGCRIALDDGVPGTPVIGLFGPLGFIDYLKIDRRWIGPAPQSRSHLKTLESIVEYGKRMNLKLIGEGVDNPNHLELMRELGVDFYQGYIDGEPPIIAGVKDQQLVIQQETA